jgi:benzoyl-CoA reductase/2-hydroxyglutaryl-CoA dehydratase subunit BcrC/BadD/HgdB
MNSEKTIKDYSKKLEKLGLELLKIQYDFKIKDNPSEKYWIKKIQEFKKYHEKVVDYFTNTGLKKFKNLKNIMKRLLIILPNPILG